jgi:uncharacterized protein YceH (UPF0502 family)
MEIRYFGWCGREDSNLHGIATASPSSWCVCQFRHYRIPCDYNREAVSFATSLCIILFVNFQLTPTEARVLGSLVEKEITTPEYYPLSLNAILNACNQKSNREPVMTLDEDAIRHALHALDQHGLARSAATDGRVPKYEHRLPEAFNFHRHEVALLCVLLLRGPQTPGELRTRTERLYQFDDLTAVHSALALLMKREPPLVILLPRHPGTKEARYAHLLSGDVSEPSSQPSSAATSAYAAVPGTTKNPAELDRLARLEREVDTLRSELADLKHQLAAFQRQFQ